jgi:hypothetical protein
MFINKIPASQLKRLHIYLDAGLNDMTGPKMLDSTRQFDATLKRHGVDHVMHAYPGGHGISGPDYGWNYDHKHARDSLSFIGLHLKNALAGQPSQAAAQPGGKR